MYIPGFERALRHQYLLNESDVSMRDNIMVEETTLAFSTLRESRLFLFE